MRAFVAVTDKDWYQFLAGRPDLDEVNFWQPGGNRVFRTLKPGEPILPCVRSGRSWIERW